jgi:hypothetical protein
LPVLTTPATRLYATGRPSSSVSESIASIRSSTRWATDDGRPSQVGVAMIRISLCRILVWMSGQSSPGPMSLRTPGLMSRSTARTQSTVTRSFSSASATTRASASVFEGAGDGLSVQLMINAFITPGYPLSRQSSTTARVRCVDAG